MVVGGNWEALCVLVLLQTDQDSLQKEEVQDMGEGHRVAGDSSVPGMCPPLRTDLGCL